MVDKIVFLALRGCETPYIHKSSDRQTTLFWRKCFEGKSPFGRIFHDSFFIFFVPSPFYILFTNFVGPILKKSGIFCRCNIFLHRRRFPERPRKKLEKSEPVHEQMWRRSTVWESVKAKRGLSLELQVIK